MKVVIYGAGAVGAFFGALLVRAGREVHFVARGAQLDALRATGIVIRSALIGDVHVPPVSAMPRGIDIGVADLVLVCVKTHQTDESLDDLATLVGGHTVLVSMQNGVESDEPLAARFGRAHVVPAAVYVGATLEEPGIVSHVAPAKIVIGARGGFDPARLSAIRDVLAATGQRVRIVDDIQQERWRKLLWNASFNIVSAVTRRGPAQLLALPETRALLLDIMREVVCVAQAQGIALREEDIDQHIAWTERAAGVRTSTMVDRERGRTTESDALVGVVIRKGKELGVATPRSEVVYALLKSIESG
jgi:2-dehydropantoate 2-reductase